MDRENREKIIESTSVIWLNKISNIMESFSFVISRIDIPETIEENKNLYNKFLLIRSLVYKLNVYKIKYIENKTRNCMIDYDDLYKFVYVQSVVNSYFLKIYLNNCSKKTKNYDIMFNIALIYSNVINSVFNRSNAFEPLSLKLKSLKHAIYKIIDDDKCDKKIGEFDNHDNKILEYILHKVHVDNEIRVNEINFDIPLDEENHDSDEMIDISKNSIELMY